MRDAFAGLGEAYRDAREVDMCQFADVPRDHLGPFAARLSPQTYVAGHVIIRQGDRGTGAYLINRGSVDIVRDRGEPTEVLLATLPEGDFFGDLALLLEEPRIASVVARTETECLVLHQADFKTLTEEDPEVLLSMLTAISARLGNVDSAFAAPDTAAVAAEGTEALWRELGTVAERLAAADQKVQDRS